MSIVTTLALLSVAGAAAFFVAGLLWGIRRRQGSSAADRLRADMQSEHLRARERLESHLDEVREALARAEERVRQERDAREQTEAELEMELTGTGMVGEATAVGGEDLSQQLAEALERQRELIAERDEMADKLEQLRQQQGRIATDADSRREREKKLTGELQTLRARTKRLTGEASALRNKLSTVEETGLKQTAQRGELRHESTELRHEVASLRQQISDLRGERLQLDKDLERALAQRDRALAELAEQAERDEQDGQDERAGAADNAAEG